MKTPSIFFILIIILIINPIVLPAQKGPTVKEEVVSFGKVSANSLVIVIPEAAIAVTEREWKSVLKVYGGKPKESKGVITAENVVINTMGPGSLTVLTKINPVSDGVQMSVAFSTSGTFISNANNPSQYAAAENLLYNFALKVAKKGVEQKKSVAQKELTALEKQVKNLEKRQKQLQRDMEKWEENIKSAKKETEKNKNELTNLDKSIKNKQEQLKKIKDRQSEINKMD